MVQEPATHMNRAVAIASVRESDMIVLAQFA